MVEGVAGWSGLLNGFQRLRYGKVCVCLREDNKEKGRAGQRWRATAGKCQGANTPEAASLVVTRLHHHCTLLATVLHASQTPEEDAF